MAQTEHDHNGPSKSHVDLESPFLQEELLGGETGDEWRARLDALEAESPYLKPSLSAVEREIIGTDERTLVDDTLKIPNRWICAIDVLYDSPRVHSRATGILIGPRYVLTARHIWPDNAQGLTVSPARNGSNSDNPFGKVKAKAFRFPEPTYINLPVQHGRSAGTQTRIAYHDDYMLIILKQDLASRTHPRMKGALGYWGQNLAQAAIRFLEPDTLQGKDIVVIGYPGDTCGKDIISGSSLQKQKAIEDCSRTREDEWASRQWRGAGTFVFDAKTNIPGRMYHTADTFGGQSGAPICLALGQTLHLVGIHVDGDTPERNRGVRVTERMLRNLCAWMNADAGYTIATVKDDALIVEPKTGTGAKAKEFFGNFEQEEMVDGEAAGGEAADEEEEELGDELDLEYLGILEYDSPTSSTSPTLGFEFDLNYGYEHKITDAKGLTPPAGFSWPSEGLKATDHEWKDSTGKISDAIVVTMDAVRLEIATVPFHIDSDTEFEAVVNNVRKFGQELIDAKKKYERDLAVPGVDGHPTTFEHPRTVVNKPEVDAHGNLKFPGDRDHASYALASVPLVIHRVSNRYPTKTDLWASPQATITLPLAEFGKLVWEIHRTMGGAPGEAFTGRSSDRLGLRDDLAWLALTRAVADRKKKIGTALSDGTTVTEADFTRSVTSQVAILLMYMLTSIKKDDRDERREQFAKGSLPLNVKTPLWQIHKFALTDREKLVLHELYTDTGKRENVFELASGVRGGNGARKLFPAYTHWDAERFLDAAPTWDTLLDALVKEKQIIVTKENRIPKKGHLKGNEILIAPLSSKIDWAKTEPRIAVEMRRLGFDAVGFAKWPGLMKRLRELARKVNP